MKNKIVLIKFITKAYAVYLFYGFFFFWSCASVCAEGKILLRHTVDVTAFPPSYPVKVGERVFIYIMVKNDGFETVTLTGGEKDSKGIIYANDIYIEHFMYKGGDGSYVEIRSSSGLKRVMDSSSITKLAPRSTVIFKRELVPFKKGSDARFCHLRFTLDAQREDKGIESLETNLVILRETNNSTK